MVGMILDAKQDLYSKLGYMPTIINARFIKPLDVELLIDDFEDAIANSFYTNDIRFTNLKAKRFDIESIARFNNLKRKENRFFLKRIYSSNELDYCFTSHNTPVELAKFFCIKGSGALRKSGALKSILNF